MTAVPEFRAIFEAHLEFVWRAVRRLGVREADVLDQAQKVFLTAYVKLAQFEGRSQVRTWLFAICQRVASDYRRTALFRREISMDTAALVLFAGTEEDLHNGAESQERARVADAILSKLPEPQRLVFVLFELEEMGGDDIARLLGISVGTVRSRLRLARRHFSREVKRLQQSSAHKQAG
ncbi:MAG TPA: RNA polymerase sigma factor [Polyangiaceae bacterium]|nr:RNA polymerase sigma factor [Polyangiaceae bacterium]